MKPPIKIGQGWQYKVYDLGNGRVIKKPYSVVEQFLFIRKDQKHKGKPITLSENLSQVKKVNRLAKEACKGIQRLDSHSMSLLGNPVFIGNVTYEQDKVIPLKIFFETCTINEGKRIFDAYVVLIKSCWRLGFSEITFNFLGNVGITSNGVLVLHDFGELHFKREQALSQVRKKKWLDKTCYLTFPEGELKNYYAMIMQRDLTEEALQELWSIDSIDMLQ